ISRSDFTNFQARQCGISPDRPRSWQHQNQDLSLTSFSLFSMGLPMTDWMYSGVVAPYFPRQPTGRTAVLFLSDPEEQKLRFQGADHFAGAPWSFPPRVSKPLRLSPPASAGAQADAGARPGPLQGIVRSREPCSTYRMDSLDGFIGTFSGLRFWPLGPNPAKILIEDVAHALAHQCRFSGHASKFYSVAEHSVHVSRLCLPEHALWGLLHDASEAYLVDLPRPLKLLPEFAAYREAERRLQRAVAVRFGLPEDQPASVTEADDTMLWIEAP